MGKSVHLQSCVKSLRSFATNPSNLHEPSRFDHIEFRAWPTCVGRAALKSELPHKINNFFCGVGGVGVCNEAFSGVLKTVQT